MLTVDDANTIIAKYGENGFWYKVDFTKCGGFNSVTKYDFMKLLCVMYTQGHGGVYAIQMNNPFFHGLHYFTRNGQITSDYLVEDETHAGYDYMTPSMSSNPPDTLYLFLTTDDSINLEYNFNTAAPMILPVNGLQVPVVNGEFDDKFYFTVARGGIVAYTIDGVEVEAETDEYGTFLRLPSAEDCIIGVKSSTDEYPMYKVTFREFKSLPIIYIPPIYRGTPQKITLINADTEEEITEFQAYYQGRLLENNIITVPSGTGNVVDIIVDLKDPNYPPVTVKLKTNVTTYSCRNQEDVETAISEGIKYIRLSYSQGINLDGVEFDDMTITIENTTFRNCIFNNSEIKLVGGNTYDDGGNVFNNCNIYSETNIPRSLRMSSSGSVFNDCTINNIRFYNYQLYFTGTITDSRFTRSLIITDGTVTLTNNEFDGISSKDYFPNFLYLTGDYTVTGNTFTLEGEWEELSFNMCIIKATDDFNPSKFINENTFNLNITYETEPTSTFYYNIVDDDKIRAVRL